MFHFKPRAEPATPSVSATAAPEPTIAWLCRKDLPGVLAVERDQPDGWTEGVLLAFLKERNHIGTVLADHAGQVVGYMAYAIQGGELQLARLAVHPAHRRHGVARHLLADLTRRACLTERPKTVVVIVPDDNLPMHLALRDSRFRCVEVLRAACDGPHDHYVFKFPA